MTMLSLVSLVLGSVALGLTGYLALLALLSRHRPPPVAPMPRHRFAIVVPAHDEEDGITATVKSLTNVDYPRNLFEVVVVADNCCDATALRAREAGARVIERFDEARRGKGYALELAFDTLLEEGNAEAVIVVDADTEVSANLLRAFQARLAHGELAVQAEYGVRNCDASWRTRLMVVALAMFHGVRSLGRERLGVSCGLRGNGMCLSRELLLEHPHQAYGLVEDVEYGIAIGLSGHRVAYAAEARVMGEMVSSADGAGSQRRRWEGGRRALAKAKVPTLLRAFWRRPSLLVLDLAIDLLVPPLATVGLLLAAGLAGEVLLLTLGIGPWLSTWLWLVSLVCLGIYVGRGVTLSGLGGSALLALLWAPAYVLWKVVRVMPCRGEKDWVRTTREQKPSSQCERNAS
jgi:1,2-diacylglycerol 3-beta-glucosyltransferase